MVPDPPNAGHSSGEPLPILIVQHLRVPELRGDHADNEHFLIDEVPQLTEVEARRRAGRSAFGMIEEIAQLQADRRHDLVDAAARVATHESPIATLFYIEPTTPVSVGMGLGWTGRTPAIPPGLLHPREPRNNAVGGAHAVVPAATGGA